MSAEATELKKKCKYLIERRIFKKYPCIVCKSENRRPNYFEIDRSHILRRSQSTKYKYHIKNILPLCKEHHALSDGDNAQREVFLKWLREWLPKHYSWWEQHKDERPQTIPLSYWEGLYKELKHYAEHPAEAYRLIYENI